MIVDDDIELNPYTSNSLVCVDVVMFVTDVDIPLFISLLLCIYFLPFLNQILSIYGRIAF